MTPYFWEGFWVGVIAGAVSAGVVAWFGIMGAVRPELERLRRNQR